ncbi:alpha-L-fucosidase [Enterococcus sp. JM4C]|uniref:alpha-L-fucosidase n=1 Tax=Candidatus Enterococcus huntleyi TaxID=1857217 RepID=UPI00137B3868|nr:alpha-L-fucosidase [Enterococcus sp. JM4C]KAF1298644.1 alpha-L-fucosidase [Enterococcus sp. JM4C]
MAIRGDIEEVKGTEDDPSIGMTEGLLAKLENFQDMKLGVIFHWGLYAEAGIVESWQLSEEDEWARKDPWRQDLETLRKDYWDLSYSFNPTQFNPQDWAEKCRAAGFKYMLFTTKHHDGFNMYDTKLSDYKITSEKYPFHSNPKSDVLKELFNAFRGQGMTVGAYYSKADWHSPYYWVPGQSPVGRYTSYSVAEDPIMWNRFVSFVHGQLTEIMSNYGAVDILWLDAGWVGPQTGENLQMAQLAAKLRQLQKDLIIVDRTIGGPYENYVTPERAVPDIPPKKVWESNIPLANNWGYVPNDHYKSLKEIIHLLVNVVTKGGNLILGVGPKPDGTLPEEAEKLLVGLGEWLDSFGEGIYGTRAVGTQSDSKWKLTQKGQKLFAFYLIEEGEQTVSLDINSLGIELESVTRVSVLSTNEELFVQSSGEYLVPLGKEQLAIGVCIETI